LNIFLFLVGFYSIRLNLIFMLLNAGNN
jgi:hypothetical protein